MSRLMRASEIGGLPVVTRAGDDVAQIRDIVFSAGGGAVGGFTLAGRGLFAGKRKEGLPWSSVQALGSAAVIITSEDEAFTERQEVLDRAAASGGGGGDVLGSQVLTDQGQELGTVKDVIVQVEGADTCDVVGYEIEAAEALRSKGTRLLMPLPDTLAASGEHLVVPAAATEFVTDDLAGFGAAVSEFRARLEG